MSKATARATFSSSRSGHGLISRWSTQTSAAPSLPSRRVRRASAPSTMPLQPGASRAHRLSGCGLKPQLCAGRCRGRGGRYPEKTGRCAGARSGLYETPGHNDTPERLRHFAIMLEISRGVAPAGGGGVQGLGAVVEFEVGEHAAHIEVGFVTGKAVAVFRTIPKIIL